MKLKKPAINSKNKKPRVKMPSKGMLNDIIAMFNQYDISIILLVMLLSAFGVIMVFSAGYYQTTISTTGNTYSYLIKQGVFAVAGFVVMMGVARIDYHWYAKIYKLAAAASIVMLLLLFTPLGVEVNYATRWLNIGITRITPSEISKLAMIIFTATFLARDPSKIKRFTTGILPLFAIMGIHAVLIVKQPNLSTAMVVCAIMAGIMFIAGLSYWYVCGGAGFVAVMFLYILKFKKDTHWYARLTNFRDPFADAQGAGYQVSQSLIALGNGGFKGLGLGNSIAKNLYLPEPQNDFILAIIGEELGFIGILALMSIYLILIYRCLCVSANAKDKLGLFMASGVTIMLALQVIINVAVVTASMPATGITLPFVSYGGTSILIFMAAMGILLNVSKKREE